MMMLPNNELKADMIVSKSLRLVSSLILPPIILLDCPHDTSRSYRLRLVRALRLPCIQYMGMFNDVPCIIMILAMSSHALSRVICVITFFDDSINANSNTTASH